jgi:hypothetical protein
MGVMQDGGDRRIDAAVSGGRRDARITIITTTTTVPSTETEIGIVRSGKTGATARVWCPM